MAKTTSTALVTFLNDVPMFEGLDIEQLEEIAQAFKARRYKAKQHIFYESDPGLMMYLIEEGQVRIYVNTLDGSETSVVMLSRGQIFGELALIDEDPRSANAVAISKTVCHTLHRSAFHELMERFPQIARNTMTLLSRRVRSTTRHVESLVSLDVMQRVARTLLDLADKHGTAESDNQIRIDMVLRDAHVASMVGASRESVNRTFRSFRDLGLIERKSNAITILDLAQMRNLLY